MNREIKFRAWDKEEKRIVEWKELRDTEALNIGFDSDDVVILEQYTGLHDKNGKEIYEGDIVKDKNGFRTVVYGDGCFRLNTQKEYPNSGYPLYPFNKHIEVIGNIHENTELLEDKK